MTKWNAVDVPGPTHPTGDITSNRPLWTGSRPADDRQHERRAVGSRGATWAQDLDEGPRLRRLRMPRHLVHRLHTGYPADQAGLRTESIFNRPDPGVRGSVRSNRVETPVVGGRFRNGAYDASAELFDPQTGTLSQTGSTTVDRGGPRIVALLDGRVLAIGGSGPDGTGHYIPLASAELYQ